MTSDYLERLQELKEAVSKTQSVLIFEMERGRDRVIFKNKDSALRFVNLIKTDVNGLIREEKKYLRSKNGNSYKV